MYLFWRSFLKSEENSHYSCIKDFNIFMFNKEEDNEKHIRLQYFSSEELEDRKKNMKIEKAAKSFYFNLCRKKVVQKRLRYLIEIMIMSHALICIKSLVLAAVPAKWYIAIMTDLVTLCKFFKMKIWFPNSLKNSGRR